jgi:hypothetical protein
MKTAKLLAIAGIAYLAIVVAVESLVGLMGARHAGRGLDPEEDWVLITTAAADGTRKDTVIAGVESQGQLYVAANHWLRGWYGRAVANPGVEIVRGDQKLACRAVPVEGAERDRIAAEYRLPFALRLLTGFPPRSFLRLDCH